MWNCGLDLGGEIFWSWWQQNCKERKEKVGPEVCFILPGPMGEAGGHHKDRRGNIVSLRGACGKIRIWQVAKYSKGK